MPTTLKMRLGESRQLRGPPGEVAHWRSDKPGVVSVTDEDLVTGRAGGLLTASAMGRAQVTATGFDKKRMVDVEVVVEALPSITVPRDSTVAMPAVEGIATWSCDNPQVAEVTASGEVRGISPGVAFVRGRGGPGVMADFRIEVSGVLEVETDQVVRLAEFFSVPVRAWRSSTSSVSVSPQGAATTGDRPRTVTITAELEDGTSVSLDLRVVRSRDARPAAPALPGSAAVANSRVETPGSVRPLPSTAAPQPAGAEPGSPGAADLAQAQEQEVLGHLAHVEAGTRDGNWAQAGAELTAADIAATGHEVLLERVRQAQERLRQAIEQSTAAGLARAMAAAGQGQPEGVARELERIRIAPGLRPLADYLRGLAELLRNSDASPETLPDLGQRLGAQLQGTWRTAADVRQFGVLPGLAELAARFGVEGMAATIVDFLGSETPGCPMAVREALRSSVGEMGDDVLLLLFERLSSTNTSDESAKWLLYLLLGLAPAKHCRVIVAFYRRLDAAARDLLVRRLSSLAESSWGDVFDLMAAILKRLPPDPGLATAMQGRLGKRELETAAIKWASRGHAGAIAVLRGLYAYPLSAFQPGRRT